MNTTLWNPKRIRRVSIIVNGQPFQERIIEASYTHLDLNHYSKLHNDEDLITNSKLVMAVLTLGHHDWDKISTLWFNKERSIDELTARWKRIQHHVPFDALPKKQSFFELTDSAQDMYENFMHYVRTLSQKRIKEMEVMEERRLFGKSDRSIQEQELIHRAYLVGLNHFRYVLKLNAPEEKDIGGASISFSSVFETMSNINVHDIDQSIRLMNKSIMSQSKGSMRWSTEQVMSPMRDSGNANNISTLIEEDDYTSCDRARNRNFSRQTIDFHSSTLIHVLPIIEQVRYSLSLAASAENEKLQSIDEIVEEELLKGFCSPPMKDFSIGISTSQPR